MTKAKRFKWWIPLLCLGVLLVLAGVGLFLWNRPLSLAYDEAESATVRNGNNGDEVILTGEDLEALLEDLRASRFIHRRPPSCREEAGPISSSCTAAISGCIPSRCSRRSPSSMRTGIIPASPVWTRISCPACSPETKPYPHKLPS